MSSGKMQWVDWRAVQFANDALPLGDFLQDLVPSGSCQSSVPLLVCASRGTDEWALSSCGSYAVLRTGMGDGETGDGDGESMCGAIIVATPE